MYLDRLEFPEEHEIPNSGLETLPTDSKTHLVFLKDSLNQFRIVNIKWRRVSREGTAKTFSIDCTDTDSVQ